MPVVVVTGSTRGIGLGLAKEFLKRGCQVVVSGRSSYSVVQALETLQQEAETSSLLGVPCLVDAPEQHQKLVQQAVERFGKVDRIPYRPIF